MHLTYYIWTYKIQYTYLTKLWQRVDSGVIGKSHIKTGLLHSFSAREERFILSIDSVLIHYPYYIIIIYQNFNWDEMNVHTKHKKWKPYLYCIPTNLPLTYSLSKSNLVTDLPVRNSPINSHQFCSTKMILTIPIIIHYMYFSYLSLPILRFQPIFESSFVL